MTAVGSGARLPDSGLTGFPWPGILFLQALLWGSLALKSHLDLLMSLGE